MKVEQAYGVLKGRWRILDYIQECNVSFISKLIFAPCALHNFCILAGDEWEDENANDVDNDNQADDGNIFEGWRRNTGVVEKINL